MHKITQFLILLFILLGTVSYAQQQTTEDITKAIAVLQPVQGQSTQGSTIHGTITFTKSGSDMLVTGDIEGLAPGRHGIHIHQYGDLSSTDGKSAGDHFNPANQQHGDPNMSMHHGGDLGNITAGSDGKAHLEIKVSGLDFSGPNSIIGRSVVVHANEDDLMSQPAGNSGARIAFGVIGIAQK